MTLTTIELGKIYLCRPVHASVEYLMHVVRKIDGLEQVIEGKFYNPETGRALTQFNTSTNVKNVIREATLDEKTLILARNPI